MVLTRRQAAQAGEGAGDRHEAGGSEPQEQKSESVAPRPHDSSDAPSENGSSVAATCDTDDAPQGSGTSENRPKKSGDFMTRLAVSVLMAAAFILVVMGGHMWVSISVVAMEVGIFREIVGLGFVRARGGRIPLWRTTGWYFFLSGLFLFYGKSVLAHFEDQQRPFMEHPSMQYALRHHTFISFTLYCTGFVGFTLSLKPGQYRYQFSYFGRALAAIVLVTLQSHFMILNVKQGLIWWILPCALVIFNDSFAYVCGRLFGRHSLTSLSPKKTWEGYIGGGVFTLLTAFLFSIWLSRYPSLICPKYEFTDCGWFCPKVQCDPLPSVFLHTTRDIHILPSPVAPVSITYRPIQVHAMALGLFASAIAPFGGFFASGLKRAFNIKDFANLFPGHGGVTDRVDCQLLMAVFTYVYLINFVQPNFVGSPDVGKVMSFIGELSTAEQVQLLEALQQQLLNKGAIQQPVFAAIEQAGAAING